MSKDITNTKRYLVFNKYGGKCAYCGCDLNKLNFNVDHINPLYRGWKQNQLKKEKGTSKIENLNPSCFSCNCSKSSYSIDEWRKELELKTTRLLRDSSQFRIAERFGLVKINKKPLVFYFEKIGGINGIR
jgi:5-methylcytosine-specific restriction endonuclease McrA